MSDERALSEMTFTEAYDAERAQCKSSEAAMGRLAGRYAAGYAYEYDRAAKLEAEVARLRDALATIWAAMGVDAKLAIEREFDAAALQARRAFYAAQEADAGA